MFVTRGRGSGGGGLCAFVTGQLKDQAYLAKELFFDARFRAPLISIWVATGGGALHDPVTTFYYLKLGVTSEQLGEIQAIAFCAALFLSPLYGWFLDTRGSYYPLLASCFLCGLGCLIRCIAPNVNWLYVGALVLGLGGGNLWTVTLTHLSVYAEESRRNVIVGAFTFQVTTLRILGKAAYPTWNFFVQKILGVEDELLRYRIHMSTCTFMCFFGFFWMWLFDGHAIYNLKPRTLTALGNDVNGEKKALVGGEKDSSQVGRGQSFDPKERSLKIKAFAILCVCLFIQSASTAAINTLWPLFVKEWFHFGPTEFSYLLLSSTVFSAGTIACIAGLGEKYGNRVVLVGTMISSLLGTIVAFQIRSQFWPFVILHTIFATLFFASCNSMGPLIKGMTTFVVPASYAGRIFAILSIATALGSIGANLSATRVYSMKSNMFGMKPQTLAFMSVSAAHCCGIVLACMLPRKKAESTERSHEMRERTANWLKEKQSPPISDNDSQSEEETTATKLYNKPPQDDTEEVIYSEGEQFEGDLYPENTWDSQESHVETEYSLLSNPM